MDQPGLPEIVIIAAIAVCLGFGGKLHLLARGAGARTAILVCGAANPLLWRLIAGATPWTVSWEVPVRGAILWLIMFEPVYRTRAWLRMQTLPLYLALIWLLEAMLGPVLLMAPGIGVPAQLRPGFQAYFSIPSHWIPDVRAYPQNLQSVISAAIFIAVSYVIVHLSLSRTRGRQIAAVWSGYKEADMSPSKSQTTRLLCASAFLAGSGFREQILGYLENENHGVSPELGVDMDLVARVCRQAKSWARRIDVHLLLVFIGGAIVAVFNPVIGAVVFVAASAILWFRHSHVEKNRLIAQFRRNEFTQCDPEKIAKVELDGAAQSALAREDQNLIVYTGFSPFVGAGTNLGGWSFVVDISKPSSNLGYSGNVVPFEIDEIYDAVTDRIAKADLNGLEVKDFFFASGREIRDDRDILPDIFGRPLQRIDPERAQQYVAGSDARIRHYKWIRVHDWGQELIMSYFLRCSLHGNSMFVEITRFILTPLADAYRQIDALKEPGAAETIGAFILALFAGPVRGVFSPLVLFTRMNEALGQMFGGKEKARRKLIADNPQFDYGAGQGFRQALSSNEFAHYFQKADGDFYRKMLDQTLLDGFVEFLEAHGIDTCELRERQTTIMNSGIIVQGGDVSAESLAVGAGSQAKTSRAPAEKKVVRKGAAA